MPAVLGADVRCEDPGLPGRVLQLTTHGVVMRDPTAALLDRDHHVPDEGGGPAREVGHVLIWCEIDSHDDSSQPLCVAAVTRG